MEVATRLTVQRRAGHRCEYCRLPQSAAPFLSFHVEHIAAQQHIQDDSLENLALACPDCNRHKGPNLTTFAPGTREIVTLFHPRLELWDDHFKLRGARIVGRTAIGRATVRLLNMNSEDRLKMRQELMAANDW